MAHLPDIPRRVQLFPLSRVREIPIRILETYVVEPFERSLAVNPARGQYDSLYSRIVTYVELKEIPSITCDCFLHHYWIMARFFELDQILDEMMFRDDAGELVRRLISAAVTLADYERFHPIGLLGPRRRASIESYMDSVREAMGAIPERESGCVSMWSLRAVLYSGWLYRAEKDLDNAVVAESMGRLAIG